MSTPISFYFACPSPWSYLSLDALREIGKRFERDIEYKPIDVERAWRETKTGRPLGEKSHALQRYRHLDLPRWATYRKVEIDPAPKNLNPATKFLSSKIIIAAHQQGAELHLLVRAFMQACWVDNKDISDAQTLVSIADAEGLDGAALLTETDHAAVADEFSANTSEALNFGAWSVPSFVVDGELFYGQDRLDLIAWRLSSEQTPQG